MKSPSSIGLSCVLQILSFPNPPEGIDPAEALGWHRRSSGDIETEPGRSLIPFNSLTSLEITWPTGTSGFQDQTDGRNCNENSQTSPPKRDSTELALTSPALIIHIPIPSRPSDLIRTSNLLSEYNRLGGRIGRRVGTSPKATESAGSPIRLRQIPRFLAKKVLIKILYCEDEGKRPTISSGLRQCGFRANSRKINLVLLLLLLLLL